MKLSQILEHKIPQYTVYPDFRRPHHQTSVGIELEVEGISQTDFRLGRLKRWKSTFDHSVPEGIELISDPVWGSAIQDALDEIRILYQSTNPRFSFKTSTHIHVNILDMEPIELYRMLMMYLKFERYFYEFFPERYNNIFCIPVHTSLEFQNGFMKLLADIKDEYLSDMEYVKYKYCGLNINSIRSHGTIEFRHLGGTKDMGLISNFIDIILNLKASAILGLDYNSSFHEVFDETYQYFNLPRNHKAKYQGLTDTVFDYLYINGVV